MSKQLQLQPRLQMLADMVPNNTRLADIGTDHGYLPVWLLQQGRIQSAIASDIGVEPLRHAQESAAAYHIQNHIEFRLCNGLSDINPHEVDTIVIAGMGGETIIHILQNASWTKQGNHTFLLQPMTKPEMLRIWLADNGFRFTEERLVWDKDFLYPIMKVTAGKMPAVSEVDAYGGVMLDQDPLYDDFLKQRIERLDRVIDGMNHAGDDKSRHQAKHLQQIRNALDEKRRTL